MSKQAVIEAVAGKVARLLEENRSLRGELSSADKAIEKFRGENRGLREEVLKLQKRVGQLELGGGITAASGDQKAARARVNRLIREVDGCIALLKSGDLRE